MHGLVEDEREWTLTTGTAVVTKKGPSIGNGDTFKVCPDCYAVCPLDAKTCTSEGCGYTFSQRKAMSLTPKQSDLIEVKPSDVKVVSESKRRNSFEFWLHQQRFTRKKDGSPFAPRYPEARYKAQFGMWPPATWRKEWEAKQRKAS